MGDDDVYRRNNLKKGQFVFDFYFRAIKHSVIGQKHCLLVVCVRAVEAPALVKLNQLVVIDAGIDMQRKGGALPVQTLVQFCARKLQQLRAQPHVAEFRQDTEVFEKNPMAVRVNLGGDDRGYLIVALRHHNVVVLLQVDAAMEAELDDIEHLRLQRWRDEFRRHEVGRQRESHA